MFGRICLPCGRNLSSGDIAKSDLKFLAERPPARSARSEAPYLRENGNLSRLENLAMTYARALSGSRGKKLSKVGKGVSDKAVAFRFSAKLTILGEPMELVFDFGYNGGQKCWNLSSDITKTSDPSPSTPNKVEFGAKWVKMSAFFGHNIARGSGGGRRYKPKAEQKIVVLRSRVLRNNCLEGLLTQSQVLLSSIVRANGRNIVGQQLPTLLDLTCCVRLHSLLHVVG